VDRKEEIAGLLGHWAQVEAGRGRVLVVQGEAGIGKTRLLYELRQRIGPHHALESACSPRHQHSALHPVIDLLKRLFDLTGSEEPAAALEKLERGIARTGLEGAASLPVLAPLLSVPLPPERSGPEASPQRRREETLETLVEICLGLAASRPLLFAIEDLHWVDPSTLELLERLVAGVSRAPILVLLTHRYDFTPAWPESVPAHRIRLERLSPEDALELVDRVTGGRELPGELVRALGEKAEGVPLYVEELTRTVLVAGEDRSDRRGEGARPALSIPDTLQESLMARLDRLGTAKGVLRIASAIGRSFSYELIAAVSSLDTRTLAAELDRLVRADILHQEGVPPAASYVFKHALIQEAAYESALRRTRPDVHRRIAEVYVERFPHVARTQPELVAHHYIAAGDEARALVFCQRAGELAMERSAAVEASSHFQLGLELLAALPAGPERTQQELVLLTALGGALMPTRGYAAPEVEGVYTRARALCESAGATRQLFSALAGLGYFHQSRAELATAFELAQRRFALARELADPALEMQAEEGMGTASYWMGHFAEAPPHFERCLEIYDPALHKPLAHVYGQDIGVVCRAYRAQALWFLGQADRALEEARESVRLARGLSHANSLALATAFLAGLHVLRREAAEAQAAAEATLELASEQHFPFWLGYGRIMRGWALAAQGRGAEGVAQLLEGVRSYQGTGAQLGGRYCVAMLAEAQRAAGKLEEAHGALSALLPGLERNDDRFWDAEVHRVTGELLRERAPERPAEAEASFSSAIEVARRQQARILELRAATSLGRMWHDRGRKEAARELVGAACDALREGARTRDVQEARRLLGELA
jgi:predicted ATPase